MSWSTIQKVIILLHILTMIAFWTCQAEEPLFEDRISPIPETEREAEQATLITNAQQTIFAPSIGAGASMLMWKGIPRAPIRRVILADGTPLAVGEVGTPTIPGFRILVRFGEPETFCIQLQDRRLTTYLTAD